MGLANSYGIVAYYEYDAWGKIIATNSASTTDYNAINANPLRYRGYIYDTETGFYYLQSRYYDPEICRFINADGYVSTGTGLLGYNMYSYCNNNPVMCTDNLGEFPWLAVAIVFAVVAVAATINDIYQIASGNVSVILPSNESSDSDESEGSVPDNVQIENSYKILTPWMQLGYSVYLNHFNNESKSIIDGTSAGVQFEWMMHNLAYIGFTVIGDEENKVKAGHVDLGRTIFSDEHGTASVLMWIGYCILNPRAAIVDLIVD